MWPRIVLEFVHVDQDRYGLECLAQTEGHEGEKSKYGCISKKVKGKRIPRERQRRANIG